MKTAVLIVATSVMLLGLPAPASAELTLCEGVWSNKPCDKPAEQLAEKQYLPPSAAEITVSKRRSWLADLDTEIFNAKREHGLNVQSRDVRLACENPATPEEECSRLIAERSNLIAALIASSPQPAATPQVENQETNAVAIDNSKAIYWWDTTIVTPPAVDSPQVLPPHGAPPTVRLPEQEPLPVAPKKKSPRANFAR